MRKIIISLLFPSLILSLSGCAKKSPTEPPAENTPEPAAEEQAIINNTPEDLSNVSKPTEEVDISAWQTYRNEEYRLALKYPKDWYYEDYTRNNNLPTVGFYPREKQKGWEYAGDIRLDIKEKHNEEKLKDYFRRVFSEKPYLYAKTVEEQTEEGNNAIYVNTVPGNIDSAISLIDCKTFVVMMATPFNIKEKLLKQMSKTIICPK